MTLTSTNRRAGDAAARKGLLGNNKPLPNSHSDLNRQVRAELTGSDTCTAKVFDTGVVFIATTKAPVLALCRQLLAAGLSPDRALEVYRGATLCLTVRSIGEGAALAVREDGGPRFVRYRPGPTGRVDGAAGGSPPIAPTDEAATPIAEAVS